MFPASFILNGLIQQEELHLLARLALMSLASLCLFVGFPLISAYVSRVRLDTGFRLARVSLTAGLGGLLMGLWMWPIVLQAMALFRSELAPEVALQYERWLRPLREARANFPEAFVLASVLPALFEELFFRGYLFSALRTRIGPGTTIFISALLFGFFHLLVTPVFGFERLLPSTCLGIVLGWIAWKTGSVLPSMLAHAVHNGMLVYVAQSDVAPLGAVPPAMLVLGVVGTVVGAVLIQVGKVREKRLALNE
jgi:ABC-2 type transport system permease protein/sodium transport system permease protein